VTYCAIWNMHRCCTSPSATNCADSSEIETGQMQFQKVTTTAQVSVAVFGNNPVGIDEQRLTVLPS